ncbi:MAG: trigger factor [Syntrophomonadaceae bacterium]|nr:trigger factor [Syntrophomonadaceae bacterium]MDD3022454.1 trigger factor [Syntrophomonadaceae bacterium]
MQVKLEKIENSEAHIEIEVSNDKVEEGLQQAYRKVVKQVSIPGFRKGKVPRELLERHFGKEVLLQEALEFIVPDAFEKAVEELNIEVLAQPEFDFPDINEGEPFRFIARVAVKPEVILGDIEGIEVSVPEFVVKEEDVEQRLEDMRARYAEVVEKTDEAANLGDTVTIDFEGFVDDVAFEGGHGEDYALELGSNTFIPGFEEQLVGLKTGEDSDVKVSFPDTYHAPDLAGQAAVFKVKIKKIEGRQLRDLDDSFAQEVSQLDTIAELRDDIRKELSDMAEYKSKEVIKNQVMEKALERCEIVVADTVVDAQVQRMMQEFEQRMAFQGLSLQQYYQITNSNEAEFSKKIWPEAAKVVKSNFMLEKLVNEKGIEISDEEVDRQIEKIAENMNADIEQAKENLADSMDNIILGLKLDKAVDYLIDSAIITVTKNESSEVESGE